MDHSIPLTRTFSRRIYRNIPAIAAGEEHSCTLTNFNNSSFYFLIDGMNSTLKLTEYSTLEFLVLFEYLSNKSEDKLLDIEVICKSSNINYYRSNLVINFKVTLNEDFLEFSQNNPIVKVWFDYEYNKFLDNGIGYNNTKTIDIMNESFIPDCNMYEIKPKNMELYDYQKRTLQKMINIENRTGNNSNCHISHNIKFGNLTYNVNPINGKINSDDDKQINLSSSGGILSDMMGLGKTITTLSLIKANTIKNAEYLNIKFSNEGLIFTNCSLIICPNHLSKQWENEAKKAYRSLKVIKFLTKRDHAKYSYKDIVLADIIIVTQQFLMNFKNYPRVEYQHCTPASISLSNRYNIIKNKFNSWKNDFNTQIGQNGSSDLYDKKYSVLLEAFHFERIIIDEGHEIFGELSTSNQSLSAYISDLMGYFKGKNYWFVSGTPFSNSRGFINALKFIKMKINIDGNELDLDSNVLRNYKFLNNSAMRKRMIKNFLIRHRKCDVEEQIDMPGYDETLLWVDQTEMEKSLYQSKVGRTSRTVLQQLCCHPLIAETFNRIVGNKEVDLDVMKDSLILHNEETIKVYSKKLENLDPLSQQYHMLKATYSKKVSEAKYMLSILKKMIEKEITEDDTCSICFDTLEDPTLTPCGHLFCNECLHMCLKAKPSCPMCKADLKGKELLSVNSKTVKQEVKKKNPLIEKYGSKLGKLISVIRHLTSNKDNRIIVFSQWNNMLNLLSKTLSENGVGNSIVKGNVWTRNSAITKFKNGVNKLGEDNKVIMLSLSNAASGTNLTEASHIFFIEPIDASRKEVKAIEGQAIGRACRIGQTNKVNIIRILARNTIEEEIFNKNYQDNQFIPIDKVINTPIDLDI